MLLGFSFVSSHVIQMSPAAAAMKKIPQANMGRLPMNKATMAGMTPQDDAGHHGSHHVAGDMHRLVTMAVRSQQFPHHTEADALPATLGIAGPSQAVDKFMNHDAYNDENKGDAPVAEATKKFSYWLLVLPYHFILFSNLNNPSSWSN